MIYFLDGYFLFFLNERVCPFLLIKEELEPRKAKQAKSERNNGQKTVQRGAGGLQIALRAALAGFAPRGRPSNPTLLIAKLPRGLIGSHRGSQCSAYMLMKELCIGSAHRFQGY